MEKTRMAIEIVQDQMNELRKTPTLYKKHFIEGILYGLKEVNQIQRFEYLFYLQQLEFVEIN